MPPELQKYLLKHWREWMLPEEMRTLHRVSLFENAEKVAMKAARNFEGIEGIYGFTDSKTGKEF